MDDINLLEIDDEDILPPLRSKVLRPDKLPASGRPMPAIAPPIASFLSKADLAKASDDGRRNLQPATSQSQAQRTSASSQPLSAADGFCKETVPAGRKRTLAESFKEPHLIFGDQNIVAHDGPSLAGRVQEQHAGQTGVRKPRIPGPAGLLLEAQKEGLQVLRVDELDGSQPSRIQSSHLLIDRDFRSQTWAQGLAALRALSSSNGPEAQLPQASIAQVLQYEKSRKVPLLLAVVSSLEVTGGCGEAFAALKDTSGEIGAGIHSSVLSEHSNFGVASVVLLRAVTVLRITASRVCLCIIAENVAKVIAPNNLFQLPPAFTTQSRQLLPAADKDSWMDDIPQSPTASQAFSAGRLSQPAPQRESPDTNGGHCSTAEAAAASRISADTDHETGGGFISEAVDANLDKGRHRASLRPQGSFGADESARTPVKGRLNVGGSGNGMLLLDEMADLMEGMEEDDDLQRTGLWTP